MKKFIMKESSKGGKAKYFTEVTIEKTATSFKFTFNCKNSFLFTPFDEYNSNLFDGNVCEIFFSVNGSREHYYEIELAPNGALFFAKVFNDSNDLNLTFMKNTLITSVAVTGNDYIAVIELPFESVEYSEGDVVLLNCFRIECNEICCSKQYLMALNPTLCKTFHTPSKFVELDF